MATLRSSSPLILIPNTDEAISFLKHMHGNRRIHLVSISNNGKVTAKTFDNANDPAVRDWIDQRQGKENIYFHVNELRPVIRDIKARKRDVARAFCFHVDVDDVEALVKISAFRPKPTAILNSGGGYHLYWRLKEPTEDLDLVECINRGLADCLGGDNCHNIDRILRVPGTVNIPSKKKMAKGRGPVIAEVLEELTEWDRRYEPGDLIQFAADARTAADDIAPEDVKPVSIEELGIEMPDTLSKLIVAGDDLERPIGAQNAHYPSRSEAVYAVTCGLARLRVSHKLIAGILVNARYGISASIREKANSVEYALRQAKSAYRAVIDSWPDLAKNGSPRPTLRNTMLAIQKLGIVAENDEFHKRKRLGGRIMQQFAHELTDDACAVLRDLIIEAYGFDPGRENTREAANTLCIKSTFHPVREYLDGLKWDGTPRLAIWLVVLMGAPDNEYVRAVGKIMLVAAVRRIRQPGVKFDIIVVLEGRQGSGKSTALRILAGDGNFSDQDILTLDAKAQAEAMEGVWIYELCELEGLSRADTNKVKAFASRAADRARPAYGRYREDKMRQNIFVGTTNDDKYLRDLTGNRRFWPVKTGVIDLVALERDRDQLWAEAAYWEAKEEPINLPEELWPVAAKEQEARLEDDPWLEALEYIAGEVVSGYERRSTAVILEFDLQIPPPQQQAYHMKRLAQHMRKLGWDGPMLMKFRDGKTRRGYQRPIGSGRDTNQNDQY